MKNVTKDIYYVGANDHQIDLFEGHYVVPNGISYNSYVIVDEKIAVMDSIDQNFFNEWISQIKEVLAGRKPDYLVVQHMEPDHSANIMNFIKEYPDVVVVSTQKAFAMLDNYFQKPQINRMTVTEGDTLSLGKHTLAFVLAPMVHWPEVMVTYETSEKVLFAADGFGKFGALDVKEDWVDEARRYYIGIVGKYGVQVQNLLKKASTLDIKTICSLHGPVLTENLGYYLGLYDTWSSYRAETEGVAIFYTSVYGHTKQAVELLDAELTKLSVPHIVCDLARSDMTENVAQAFRYSKVVFATTTFNMSIFPFMHTFLTDLVERNFQKKDVALIENGSWAPNAIKVMKGILENSKELNYISEVTIKSAMSEENKEQIKEMAKTLAKGFKVPGQEKKVGKWICPVCGYVYEGEELDGDAVCPACGHTASDFEPIE